MSEGVESIHADNWGMSIQETRTSKCKDPEAGICWGPRETVGANVDW